ncbi:CrcB family protein [Schaalia sp. lx-260]|uniref:CrcB family protein n=1 Tax=Schaalia sp. lx-260 TaxID=2899082 RepID=UPI001E483EC8|nr:CrcB family protein [Schaalia sp. lx-260]MCD4549345.1 CrcB family protein [Schaalia sp. lx-260]
MFPRYTVRVRHTLLIGYGAALGACCRYAIATYWYVDAPFSLLCINVMGCFLMGILQSVHPIFTTGFLGGFTSFSTFIFLTYAHMNYYSGFLYICITMCSCFAAWWAGDKIHRLLQKKQQ